MKLLFKGTAFNIFSLTINERVKNLKYMSIKWHSFRIIVSL